MGIKKYIAPKSLEIPGVIGFFFMFSGKIFHTHPRAALTVSRL
jgi:hypothetical protein